MRTRGVVQLLASFSSPQAVHLDPLPPVDQLIVPMAARKPASARSPQRGHTTSSSSSVLNAVPIHPRPGSWPTGRSPAPPVHQPSTAHEPRRHPAPSLDPSGISRPAARASAQHADRRTVAPIVAPSHAASSQRSNPLVGPPEQRPPTGRSPAGERRSAGVRGRCRCGRCRGHSYGVLMARSDDQSAAAEVGAGARAEHPWPQPPTGQPV
jgi:hypothetical protein